MTVAGCGLRIAGVPAGSGIAGVFVPGGTGSIDSAAVREFVNRTGTGKKISPRVWAWPEAAGIEFAPSCCVGSTRFRTRITYPDATRAAVILSPIFFRARQVLVPPVAGTEAAMQRPHLASTP
jgi:hypothetical protein